MVLITLIVIVGVVGVLELYCGYSFYRHKDSIRNELNAIRLREPIHNRNSEIDFDGKKIVFRTDSLGFILPYENPDSVKNIIAFIGGSTTECKMVSEENRVHRIVEKSIEGVAGLNIGHSGNHSVHSMNILVNKVNAFNPKYVVINHNVNDLSILLNEGTYFNSNHSRSLLLTSTEDLYNYKVGYPSNKFVKKYIPHIALVLLPTSFDGEKASVLEFRDGPLLGLKLDSVKQIFKKSIDGLVKYAKAWGVKPVLLAQGSCMEHYESPNKHKYVGYDLAEWHGEFNNVIRAVAKENDVLLVDGERLMKNKKELFYDPVHYTDSGSILIGNAIAEVLKSDLAVNEE